MQTFVISFAVFFMLCYAYILNKGNIFVGIWQAVQSILGLALIIVVLLMMLGCMILAGLWNLVTIGRFWS